MGIEILQVGSNHSRHRHSSRADLHSHYSTILYREKGIIKGSLIQIIASALGAAVTIGLLMIVIYIFFPMLIPIILHQIVKIWMIVTLEAFLFQIFDIGWTWIYSLIG